MDATDHGAKATPARRNCKPVLAFLQANLPELNPRSKKQNQRNAFLEEEPLSVNQYEKNLATPVYLGTRTGELLEWGSLADIPRKPVVRFADRLLRFDMLARRTSIHDAVKSLAAAIENFPEEWKRQARNALRTRSGMPIPFEDSMPIN
jgi:hypothetical protein